MQFITQTWMIEVNSAVFLNFFKSNIVLINLFIYLAVFDDMGLSSCLVDLGYVGS